jgi:gamma-glutamyltranspeptidase/glutathione hydrolase
MKTPSQKPRTLSRRAALKTSGVVTVAALLSPRILIGAAAPDSNTGQIIGEAAAERVGSRVLADGGNVVDAIAAGALAAAVAAPNQTGIGGYGMCAVLALDGGKKITSIDGNSAAPAAMRADTFKPDGSGRVPGRINESGWMSAGVPGVLAGLHLALEKFGTRPFSEIVQPAIEIVRNGFPWPGGLATFVAGNERLRNDPGSRKLFVRDGKPLRAGEVFRNPELAEMLTTLAKANSIEAFYRGDIAQRIAEAFQKNGGLVTARDMADYRARIVEPLTLEWGPHTVHTAPLTAGGLSVLQMLRALQAMNWAEMPADLARTHARIEAMRLAWRDRLTLLGDPASGKIPVERLLSKEYARECAEKILATVKAGKFLTHNVTPQPHTGTVNLSAADRHGNFVALTLTHGEAFGARVTVDGLGLTLGHGMSRFDPRPEHPNAPGPGKRPLNNMTPSIVTRDGRAVLAIGGAGGRKIPNSEFEILTRILALGKTLPEAMAAPRIHTEGDRALSFEKSWPAMETAALSELGYRVSTGGSASIGAVGYDKGALIKLRR